VTETLKQTLIQQFVETFDTLEDHGFDNTQGLDNVSAVYQFVDKVYAAQVFNYGKRLLYDLIVPEPAAQWLEARWLKPVDPNAPAGPPPLDLSLTPASLTADTYAAAVAKYRASGVAPPPKSLETAGTTLVSTPDQKANDAPGTIKVPEGYEASYAWVTGNYDWTDGNANSIGVYLGDKVVGFNQNDGPQIVNFTLPAMGDIPVGLHAYHVSNYTITIRVFCLPSQDAIAKWQNDAFDKILLGWAKWNSDYQDALARAQQDVPTGDPKFGTNPETNQEIARLELKRNVLQMMIGEVAQKSITPPPPNPPAPSFPQPAMPDALAHGEIIRFFEQAFEWEQVSYVCYPYFWGRKQETWYDKLRLTSDDPEFQQFLRAGAARTVIPVRRGYEDALTYFFATGQLWKGGEPPQVSDPNYLPIAQEIKELTGAPGDEVPYGPQWEIQLPTQLVRLRADGKLPVWKQPDPNVWTWTSDDGS
jgi:hypothetical protein